MDAIGARVKEVLGSRGLSQAELARSLDLSESALSKSINGTRAFSAVELAEVADRLDVSMHWLVTGEPDPFELIISARHDYDSKSDRYSSSLVEDLPTLKDIALVYRQAYG
ncbi:helix-turn-helix transcriptional regulator [Actinomyces viscosus]|uniref:helix-turn-helix domain-containing protein n=1 Tax=Actinomyces viscosus TaxID=1656 RepID=UPI0028E4595B|nr:helix-turn-helix transcriptional regulator [Actinomyces viscosus]